MFSEIEQSIETRPSRKAPEYFDRYGKNMYYMWFNLRNTPTQWYVFYTQYDDNGQTVYLVRYIGTNHTVAQHL